MTRRRRRPRGLPENTADLVTTAQAAEMCGVSWRTFMRYLAAGQIEPVGSVGGAHVFRRSDVEELALLIQQLREMRGGS